MKQKVILSIILFCVAVPLFARQVVNEIRVIVYSKDGGVTPILTSDVRPELDGTPCTLRDIVLKRLMINDALRFNMNVTEDDADKYLETLQKANNMSRAAMEHIMGEMGYTYEEGKEHLRCRHMIEQVLDHRVKSDRRLLVQREDVEKFDAEHPVFEDAVYTLCQVCIPNDKQELSQEQLDALPWEEPFEVQENQLAEDKQFIINEPIGAIIDRDFVDEGVELTRLVAKQPKRRVPVDERYDYIINTIRMQRFEEILKEYHQTLLNEASLRFTYPEDKILVLEG